MKTVSELAKKVNETTDQLTSQFLKAQAYQEGYVRACEDFGRIMRKKLQKIKVYRN